MKKIFNPKETKEKRINLRKTATKAEVFLWQALKKKQLDGYKFRRQYGVGEFIIDFYCPTLMLAIEVDGGIHNNLMRSEYDLKRQHFIESKGINFLRFNNEQVLGFREGVIQNIREELERLKVKREH